MSATDVVSVLIQASPFYLLAAIVAVRARTLAREGRPVPAGRLLLIAAGVAVGVAADLPPIGTQSDERLSIHMVQHMLIGDVAAFLIAVGLTGPMLRPILTVRGIRRLRVLAHPLVAVPLWVVVYYGWHIPVLYDAALNTTAVHTLEHFSFAAAGLLYWWHLLSPIRSRLRLGGMGPIAYMGVTKILVGFLGIALAFAPELIYDAYDHPGKIWGMTALDDQHVAGLIMALEQSIVMGIALAWLFARMLSESEEEERRAERYSTTP